MGDAIWVVVSTVEVAQFRDARIKELVRTGVDMLYPPRLKQAEILSAGDRVVIHCGGRVGSHPLAQHLIAAGRVADPARRLVQSDVADYTRMFELTTKAFTKFPDEPVGIIRFDLIDAIERGVKPLPRNTTDGYLYRPMRGNNFLRHDPDTSSYRLLGRWWHEVADVPE